ncbi:Flp1 family type IVb pilin [Gorillibacterium massiliense]|uniref:Flp1 family type IVb pilin n=1 Tax=Gorillibacterium massiliense TaxID=1280390 RepID=UPI0004AFDADC|nr:Flp1 family type IVb pilin [Gorillibacterium massiliense]
MLANVKNGWIRFYRDEDGIGTLELLLILAVLVLIAIAFRKWIFKWVNALFEKTDKGVTDQMDSSDLATPTP